MSCAKEKKRPVYVDTSDFGEEQVDSSSISEESIKPGSKEIIVPFREKNGVKYVRVSVNGVGLDMIFDTGCSSTLISIAEARYLYEKGKLTNINAPLLLGNEVLNRLATITIDNDNQTLNFKLKE